MGFLCSSFEKSFLSCPAGLGACRVVEMLPLRAGSVRAHLAACAPRSPRHATGGENVLKKFDLCWKLQWARGRAGSAAREERPLLRFGPFSTLARQGGAGGEG